MDLGKGSKRKWVQSPDSAVYIFGGDLKVVVYPSSPASHHPLPRSLPPSSAPLASATPCVLGQISPTVESAGLCGGLFILERGLPSGSLHLSKHPPGRCSVFPALHSLTSPTPLPASSPPGSLCSFSHTLLLLYHSFTAGPLVIPPCRPSFPFSLGPSLSLPHFFFTISSFFSPLRLSCCVLSSIAAFSHDSVYLALSPLTLS